MSGMPELSEADRLQHNSEQAEKIHSLLEAIFQLRSSGRSWGELVLTTIWRDGSLEEFRIDQGDVHRCPAVSSSQRSPVTIIRRRGG